MSRTSILRGPCKMTFNTKVFYSKGDVVVNYIQELTPLQTSRFGKVGDSVSSVMAQIEFEPDGRWLSAALSTMLPFNTKTIGSSVFGADSALTINSVDGKKTVFTAAAVTTKKQTLRLGIKETIFGPMQFTALYGAAKDPTDADALVTFSNESYPGDANFDRADILKQAYDIAWSGKSAPWDAFMAKDDINIAIDLDLTPETSQSHGIFDYIFGGMQASATFEPDGPTSIEAVEAALLQDTGAALGRCATSQGAHLNISGTGVYIRLYNAAPVNPKERYSAKLRRMGALEWRASRSQTTGTIDPLIYVGASAPA